MLRWLVERKLPRCAHASRSSDWRSIAPKVDPWHTGVFVIAVLQLPQRPFFATFTFVMTSAIPLPCALFEPPHKVRGLLNMIFVYPSGRAALEAELAAEPSEKSLHLGRENLQRLTGAVGTDHVDLDCRGQ